MDQLIKRVGLAVAAVALLFLGYSIFSGDPIELPFRSYKSPSPAAQDWLITAFGETAIGLIYLGLGLVFAAVLIRSLMRKR